jgi:hypothetical protein
MKTRVTLDAWEGANDGPPRILSETTTKTKEIAMINNNVPETDPIGAIANSIIAGRKAFIEAAEMLYRLEANDPETIAGLRELGLDLPDELFADMIRVGEGNLDPDPVMIRVVEYQASKRWHN